MVLTLRGGCQGTPSVGTWPGTFALVEQGANKCSGSGWKDSEEVKKWMLRGEAYFQPSLD